MHIITILLPFFLIFSCQPQKQVAAKPIQPVSLASLREKYKVTRIDSIDHIYVIYASKDSVLYKMVSRKNSELCSDPIKVGGEYPLVPLSIVPKEVMGMDLSVAMLQVSYINYEGVAISLERDLVRDVHSAVNLRGLCLTF